MFYAGVCTGVLSWGSAIRWVIPVGVGWIGISQPWSCWKLLEEGINMVVFNITYIITYRSHFTCYIGFKEASAICTNSNIYICVCIYSRWLVLAVCLGVGCLVILHLFGIQSYILTSIINTTTIVNITTALGTHQTYLRRNYDHRPVSLDGGITRLLVYIALNIHFPNIPPYVLSQLVNFYSFHFSIRIKQAN